MKKWVITFTLLWGIILVSCNNDDDICTSGERTPRMKLKFKDRNHKLKTIDTLYINADYGNGEQNIIAKTSVDSVLIPLKIDGSTYTDFKIYTSQKSTKKSILRVHYTEKLEYVSPACGIRKLYENLTTELLSNQPIINVEQNQTEILNEEKTHIYLVF